METVETLKNIANQRWEDKTSARSFAKYSDAINGDEKQRWLEAIREQVGDVATGTPAKQVLDVGTGAGLLALFYAELGHEVTGLDFSNAMIAQAKERAEAQGLPATFMHGDAEALPFENESFDVVTNRIMIWSLPNPGGAVREWARVLKPGGKVVLFGNHHDVQPSLTALKLLKWYRLRMPFVPRNWSLSSKLEKQWQESYKHLPFHHAPAPKIKALFDAAGLEDTAIISLAEKFAEERRVLFRRYTVPWHAVVGTKAPRAHPH